MKRKIKYINKHTTAPYNTHVPNLRREKTENLKKNSNPKKLNMLQLKQLIKIKY